MLPKLPNPSYIDKFAKTGPRIIKAARDCHYDLVNNLESIETASLPLIREQIKTWGGGQIKLHPTSQGHLEAELAGDYAGF